MGCWSWLVELTHLCGNFWSLDTSLRVALGFFFVCLMDDCFLLMSLGLHLCKTDLSICLQGGVGTPQCSSAALHSCPGSAGHPAHHGSCCRAAERNSRVLLQEYLKTGLYQKIWALLYVCIAWNFACVRDEKQCTQCEWEQGLLMCNGTRPLKMLVWIQLSQWCSNYCSNSK